MGDSPVRYRFGDAARVGVLLGMGMRQAAPITVGVLWLTLWLMAQMPIVGLVGLMAGVVIAFGRWRRAPLYEVAVPGVRLVVARCRRRTRWHKADLLAAGPGLDGDVPPALRGLQLLETEIAWPVGTRQVGVVVDRSAGTVSMLIPVAGERFPVASPDEQDRLVASWGTALAPFARARCPVSRVTWQEWSHPCRVDGHRDFVAGRHLSSPHADAVADYECLLVEHEPFTTAHEVIVTVTVERRRVRTRAGVDAAIDVLAEETRQFAARLAAAGFIVDEPMSVAAVASASRCRSDPSRLTQLGSLHRSLASAAGRGAPEWGPMCVEDDWFHCRVDESLHRSFRVSAWPMLPVGADWLTPLLTVDGATRTVTVVLEPVPLGAAASDANRHLTSIEADQQQKEQHGFRLTARERRRHADVETRERELAEGHPMFRHVGIVTVTASTLEGLDDACQIVEQAAAQSLIDLRPLAARQTEGWVASLPLGRSVRSGPTR